MYKMTQSEFLVALERATRNYAASLSEAVASLVTIHVDAGAIATQAGLPSTTQVVAAILKGSGSIDHRGNGRFLTGSEIRLLCAADQLAWETRNGAIVPPAT